MRTLHRQKKLTYHEALEAIRAVVDAINTEGSITIGSKEAMDLIDALWALESHHHGER